MNRSDSINQDKKLSSNASTTLEELISNYEIAVLSTLFEQNDCDKVGDLAKQWGYQQEYLTSVWQEIHPNVADSAEVAPLQESTEI